jgi:hypothetical protein
MIAGIPMEERIKRLPRKKLVISYAAILLILLVKIKLTHYNGGLSWTGLIFDSLIGLLAWWMGLFLLSSQLYLKRLVGYALTSFGFILLWVPVYVAFFFHGD